MLSPLTSLLAVMVVVQLPVVRDVPVLFVYRRDLPGRERVQGSNRGREPDREV